MDQFDEIRNLMQTISDYLRTGKMSCAQVSSDDLLYFIQQEYDRAGMNSDSALISYKGVIDRCIASNDPMGLSGLLNCMIAHSKVLTELYYERTKKYDLEITPYRVETLYYRNLERNWADTSLGGSTISSGFNGKGAVYSAITGGYDKVHDPEVVDDRLDYYLFTDNPDVHSDVYKVVVVENKEQLDPVRLARKIKILGNWDYLNDYDFAIWIDGKLQILGDVFEYIKMYSKGNPIICFTHPKREDPYQEASECIKIMSDDEALIRSQIDRYRSEGLPEHSGLIDSCFLVKDNHSDLLKKTMQDWWNEIKNGSKRDQLSFNYACWKNGLKYDSSPLVCYDNKYVKTHKHT